MMKSFKVLSSTGNLGDNIIEKDSFYKGTERELDYLAADAGTADAGPTFLGSDLPHNPVEWEQHDLELLLLASREKDIPMIVGSCSTSGTNRGVDLYYDLVSNIAKKNGMKSFKVARIYSQIDKKSFFDFFNNGRVKMLGNSGTLNEKDVTGTDTIVAMMGVEPIISALEDGADVILAGRCCDDAVYASYLIWKGIPRGIAFHLGKAIECASLVCEPQMVKESVLGTVNDTSFLLEPMHNQQKATTHSVAAHSMYERVNPYIQEVPGGILDMHNTTFEQVSERICKVSGSTFIPSPDGSYMVKIEGAGKVGKRVFHFVGIRDSYAISYISDILKETRSKVSEIISGYNEGVDYHLYFHTYGINGVMGDIEPIQKSFGHEVGILIEVVAKDIDLAERVAKCAKFRLFYLSYPGQKNSSGGSSAIVVDEPLFPKYSAYKWTINHLLELREPQEVFPCKMDIINSD